MFDLIRIFQDEHDAFVNNQAGTSSAGVGQGSNRRARKRAGSRRAGKQRAAKRHAGNSRASGSPPVTYRINMTNVVASRTITTRAAARRARENEAVVDLTHVSNDNDAATTAPSIIDIFNQQMRQWQAEEAEKNARRRMTSWDVMMTESEEEEFESGLGGLGCPPPPQQQQGPPPAPATPVQQQQVLVNNNDTCLNLFDMFQLVDQVARFDGNCYGYQHLRRRTNVPRYW
jgi:hypothetical protein